MAHHSLNDSFLTINLSLNQYDDLKANALVQVILSVVDLEEISHITLHDFLWALSDFTQQAEAVCNSLTPLLPKH